MTYDVVIDGTTHRLEVTRGERTWSCVVDGHLMEVDAQLTGRDFLSLLVGNKAYEVRREHSTKGELHMVIGSERYAVEMRDPRSIRNRRGGASSEAGPQKLTAAMPGKIVRIMVNEKDEVKAGQAVLVMEAMKMQNEMKSSKDGRVQKILTSEGSTVNAGDTLAVIE